MNLLFVANFPPGVGYAWNTIEEVLRRLAIRWIAERGKVFVVYPPSGDPPPSRLREAGVEFLTFDYLAVKSSPGAAVAFCRLLRRHRIEVLYLTDKPSWRWHYPAMRLAGVRRIVIHDRSSGERAVRPGLAGTAMRLWHRIPGISADILIGVSRFVAERMLKSGTPPARTVVVYNGIEVERFDHAPPGALAALLGLPASTPVVFGSGRAHGYKGIETLIRAAAQLEADPAVTAHVAYCGDGPALEEFQRLAASLGLRRFHFLGRRSDVPALLGSAAVAVVPSHWAEAFGLTVVEAMAAGVPVVATTVGGIPELVDEGVTGLLVPPMDPERLATAVARLLGDPDLRRRMGKAGQDAARARFAIDRVVDELYPLVHGASRPR